MAKSANLNIRIDPDTKAQAERLFSPFGITVTDAVNMFLHQSIIDGGLPFALKVEKPNAETVKAIENVRNGVGISKGFASANELMEDLNADD